MTVEALNNLAKSVEKLADAATALCVTVAQKPPVPLCLPADAFDKAEMSAFEAIYLDGRQAGQDIAIVNERCDRFRSLLERADRDILRVLSGIKDRSDLDVLRDLRNAVVIALEQTKGRP